MEGAVSKVEKGMSSSEVQIILGDYYLTKKWKWSGMECEEYRYVDKPTNHNWNGESSMMVCYKSEAVELAGVSIE